jgi:ABC-type branched-subunit amino acid transport system substrate-binding protein
VKVPALAVGYGTDFQRVGQAAQQDAQGPYFTLNYEPVELHSAANEEFQAALQKYAGETGDPFFNTYDGYISVDAFLTGLKAAGPRPTQAAFINAMLGMRS